MYLHRLKIQRDYKKANFVYVQEFIGSFTMVRYVVCHAAHSHNMLELLRIDIERGRGPKYVFKI
jgi:hypothetical protein